MVMDRLPPDIRVLERGWLSSNNILLLADEHADLVDSGYVSHDKQTLQLVHSESGGLTLRTLVNTHLHSDHCGGNAALQTAYPRLRTLIPPGLAPHVQPWDPEALTYTPTGQTCPPFQFDGTLQPGTPLRLGRRLWEVHAAPGHDPHSVILFEPELKILISADALWQHGFGVVFPEIEGEAAFAEVSSTLDLIESLQPALLIPGHGRPFTDLSTALSNARQRLTAFVTDPVRHAKHAAKVLLKFKLLEQQRMALTELQNWFANTRYLQQIHGQHFKATPQFDWIQSLVDELVHSDVAGVDGCWILNR